MLSAIREEGEMELSSSEVDRVGIVAGHVDRPQVQQRHIALNPKTCTVGDGKRLNERRLRDPAGDLNGRFTRGQAGGRGCFEAATAIIEPGIDERANCHWGQRYSWPQGYPRGKTRLPNRQP
jgi:hypothetical protein